MFTDGRKGGESHLGLIRAYNVDLANGVNNTLWLNECTTYANNLASTPDYFQIPFLVELYKRTGNSAYLTKATNAGNSAWSGGHNTLRFRGALEDYAGGGVEHDRESGYLALKAYMSLYKETSNSTWLDRAKVAADYSETWQMLQNLKTLPEDAVLSQCMYGNDIPPYGLSGVHAGSSSGDQYQALVALEFYQLYEATNDSHYLDFAENIEHNSMLYTNMGDKQGYMADWVHGTSLGFTNEYLGCAANDYWNNNRRGAGHDSNIGWTSYVLLAMTQKTLDYTGNYNFCNTTGPQVQPPSNSASFSDDFSSGSSKWTTYGGSWSVVNGQYTVGAHAGAKSVANNISYGNFSYDADVSVGSTGNAGLIFRVNGPATGVDTYGGYCVALNSQASKIEFGKANGSWKGIVEVPMSISANTFYHLKVVCSGPSIKVYFNHSSTPCIDIVDYSWIKGAIGVRTYNADAKFDNVVCVPDGDVVIPVSQGKTATASTTYNSSYAASKSVDGDIGTRWAASNSSKPQWLKVDLGTNYNVKKCETYFEYPHRYYKYKIEYSTDNTNWYTFADKTSNTVVGNPCYIDTGNVTARYVRITTTGTQYSADWASIWEFKVFN